MNLKEWLEEKAPDKVIYLGCDSTNRTKKKTNGSGFVFIGYARDVPIEFFGDRNIREVYPHTSNHPGTTVIIEGLEQGKYWMWNEYNKDEIVPEVYVDSDAAFEELLMAIAKQTISEYRDHVRAYLARRKPETPEEIDLVIKVCRDESDLDFLKGSGTGDYLIKATEDEERIFYLYPKARNMPYERRYKFLKEKQQELMHERIKEQEKTMYATIRGRSVKHDTV